jgi:hypothetical protein
LNLFLEDSYRYDASLANFIPYGFLRCFQTWHKSKN